MAVPALRVKLACAARLTFAASIHCPKPCHGEIPPSRPHIGTESEHKAAGRCHKTDLVPGPSEERKPAARWPARTRPSSSTNSVVPYVGHGDQGGVPLYGCTVLGARWCAVTLHCRFNTSPSLPWPGLGGPGPTQAAVVRD